MLAYAGLDPPKYESSEENHKGYMVKHNSSHLRQLIMNASDSFVLHNLCCISISVQKEKWRQALENSSKSCCSKTCQNHFLSREKWCGL